MTRDVVVLCGPPGAGKTTLARASGLPVFDVDEPRWSSDREFRDALADLGRRRDARAVVIRSGATSTARAAVADLVGATAVYVVRADRDELHRRVRHRGRADRVRTLAGIDRWFDRFDRADGVLDFPGWQVALATETGDGITSQDW